MTPPFGGNPQAGVWQLMPQSMSLSSQAPQGAGLYTQDPRSGRTFRVTRPKERSPEYLQAKKAYENARAELVRYSTSKGWFFDFDSKKTVDKDGNPVTTDEKHHQLEARVVETRQAIKAYRESHPGEFLQNARRGGRNRAQAKEARLERQSIRRTFVGKPTSATSNKGGSYAAVAAGQTSDEVKRSDSSAKASQPKNSVSSSSQNSADLQLQILLQMQQMMARQATVLERLESKLVVSGTNVPIPDSPSSVKSREHKRSKNTIQFSTNSSGMTPHVNAMLIHDDTEPDGSETN